MSIINQSVYCINNEVLNSNMQSKYCLKLFVSILSLSKETLKKPKGYLVHCHLAKQSCEKIIINI